MANELNSLGRTDLDRPPAPTTPPEAAPRLAQLNARESEGAGPSLGSLQQTGIVFQTGMAVEKGILALASLLPGFDQVAQNIIPQLREGIRLGISGSGSENAPAPAGTELPQTQVSPLQQG